MALQVITKALLSGSTSGRGIVVAATATAGTLIHTAVAGASSIDKIYLYAVNISATAVKLTLEWGSAGVGDNIELAIPGESGLVYVTPLPLNGGLVVRAFAGTINVISIYGEVDQLV